MLVQRKVGRRFPRKSMTSKFDLFLTFIARGLLWASRQSRLLTSSHPSSLPSGCEESQPSIPTQGTLARKNVIHPQLFCRPCPYNGQHGGRSGGEAQEYLSPELVYRSVSHPLLMNLPVFIHDKPKAPKGPGTSSRFIGVIFGMLRETLFPVVWTGARLTGAINQSSSSCFSPPSSGGGEYTRPSRDSPDGSEERQESIYHGVRTLRPVYLIRLLRASRDSPATNC